MAVSQELCLMQYPSVGLFSSMSIHSSHTPALSFAQNLFIDFSDAKGISLRLYALRGLAKNAKYGLEKLLV